MLFILNYKNKSSKHLLMIFLVLVFSFQLISAQSNSKDNTEPSWVYLKKADNFKEQGDYSTAIIEARKARLRFIEEQLDEYFLMVKETFTEKTDYELMKLVNAKEIQLKKDDIYPEYHELMGDLYMLTDFLEEAEKEYKISLEQKNFFDYTDKVIEIKYKLAEVYNKKRNYELEDIVYREILEEYFEQKSGDYWNRMKYNIRKDQTLSHVFRIYRVDGIKYLEALFKVGRRAALLKRKNESLFYLANAAIVWMTYYNIFIKNYNYNFQYSSPVDFINYLSNRNIFEYLSEDYLIHEIMFYIAYNFYLNDQDVIMNQFFELSRKFGAGTDEEEILIDRIAFLLENRGYVITYEEIIR